ncbi:hypothetical protein GCM10017786_23050 [Amycolatopsis deserti]|uniref:Uncharacterized protein n=1 Tax=Amycolatopsis deserti TaxID=185696 RepID=A0ABQ3IQ07_9PSEU|nr:hypothetical protein [Amycolatopsis deserti]GHE90181.1 hypothetical protein GCM10017786_23050 [Amycolatopsis deserti]
MSPDSGEPAARARAWAEAIAALVERGTGVRGQRASTADIQQEIRFVPPGPASPVLVIVCEESQGSLSLERIRGVSVLYEFDGEPDELPRRWERDRRRRPWLSEVDLADHAIAVLTAGYRFRRVPFHEELRINTTPPFRWITVDLGWPPFSFHRWAPVKPSGSRAGARTRTGSD